VVKKIEKLMKKEQYLDTFIKGMRALELNEYKN
jgi:hypothetical protein